jgi:hypothetical protein
MASGRPVGNFRLSGARHLITGVTACHRIRSREGLTVPEVKQRLIVDQLGELIAWLESGDDERPKLFGTQDEYEWLLRLAAVATSLTGRHQVDGQGRCVWCHQPRYGWRRLLPRWSDRTPCRVRRTVEFYVESQVETVWWQMFSLRGDDTSLDEVRAWLRPDEDDDAPVEEAPPQRGEVDDDYGRHALLSDGRVRLREDSPPEQPRAVRPYVPPAAIPTEQIPRIPTPPCEAVTEQLPKINEP